jgi:hypothetical protein
MQKEILDSIQLSPWMLIGITLPFSAMWAFWSH